MVAEAAHVHAHLDHALLVVSHELARSARPPGAGAAVSRVLPDALDLACLARRVRVVELVLLGEEVVVAQLRARRGVHEQLDAAGASAAPFADREIERVVRPRAQLARADADGPADRAGSQQLAGFRVQRAALAGSAEDARLAAARWRLGLRVVVAAAAAHADKGTENYDVQEYVITYARCR